MNVVCCCPGAAENGCWLIRPKRDTGRYASCSTSQVGVGPTVISALERVAYCKLLPSTSNHRLLVSIEGILVGTSTS